MQKSQRQVQAWLVLRCQEQWECPFLQEVCVHHHMHRVKADTEWACSWFRPATRQYQCWHQLWLITNQGTPPAHTHTDRQNTHTQLIQPLPLPSQPHTRGWCWVLYKHPHWHHNNRGVLCNTSGVDLPPGAYESVSNTKQTVKQLCDVAVCDNCGITPTPIFLTGVN